MRIPFTIEQFLDAFRRYNEAVWPAQWLLGALAVAAVVLVVRGPVSRDRWISAILGALWLWAGIAYHLMFFARVNPAAISFGAAFIVESGLLAWAAWRPAGLVFRPRTAFTRVAGGLLIAYALAGYPILAAALGHRYPATPTFGVPCPLTIFTLGMLVWAGDTVPRRLLVVPIAWSIVGLSGATLLAMPEDFGLGAAALIAVLIAMMASPRRRAKRALPLTV